MLVKNGYEVFGIARDFSKVHKEEQFNMIECDITDTEKILPENRGDLPI